MVQTTRERLGDILRRPPRDPRDPALVPVGPPKKPLLSSGAALPLPEPEIRDIDAIGRPSDADEGSSGSIEERAS
jgi:hypothetical protein